MTGPTQPAAVTLWYALTGAVQSGELDKARDLVTDDFTWEVMGRFLYAGHYEGVEGLATLFRGVREASGNTFHMETELTLGDDDAAAIVGTVSATRGAKTLDGRNIFILRCRDGRLACGWTVPMDQYKYDEFWE